MKFLVLHLSDIHLLNETSYSSKNIESITNTLTFTDEISHIFLIISGDITFDGSKDQFIIADCFYDDLCTSLKTKFSSVPIKIFVVPGNHDNDYTTGMLTTEELTTITKSGTQEKYLLNELDKLKNFFEHAKQYNCFVDNNYIIHSQVIQISEMRIKINLINTATFSSRQTDNGLHFISDTELEKLSSNSNHDFTLSIMHHPPHCFCQHTKNLAETILEQKSDLLLLGHEHNTASKKIVNQNNFCSVNVLSGGKLANKGDWSQSEFYYGILDTTTRTYDLYEYKRSSTEPIYVRTRNSQIAIDKSSTNQYGVIPKKQFINELLNDSKFIITDNILNYYVFPLLSEQISSEHHKTNKEISSLDTFVKELQEQRKIIVWGKDNSGKSAFAKNIFMHFSATKFVLYLTSSSITSNKFDRIIKTSFEDIYTDDHIAYEKFLQAPFEDKLLILDDADKIDEAYFEEFLNFVDKNFGFILQLAKNNVEFDIKERLKQRALKQSYRIFELCPFYADKRKELVSNIINLLSSQEDISRDKKIALICDTLTRQKRFYGMHPEFIILLTQYYHTHMSEALQNQDNLFSKVFENNIVNLLTSTVKKITVDKVFILLDKIAFKMHTDKKYPMSQEDIIDIIKTYNEEFNSDVNISSFLETLVKSKIFTQNMNFYSFKENSYYAYFIAREIRRKFTEEGDFSEFEKILRHACFSINSDIMMFVTYIVDNVKLIRHIMCRAKEFASKWTEFELYPITISYLSDTNQLQVKNVSDADRTLLTNHQAELEKEEKRQNNDIVIDYGYDEDNLSLLDEMLRAMSLMMVLSRTLPSFEHMMKKQDKEECVELIYTLPLKIFNTWATEVEKSKQELIEDIKLLYDTDYRKDDKFQEDGTALNILRWESISLLLELMNSSMGNATKENTLRYIDAFDYKDTIPHKIEHLMSLDKRDAVEEFIKEAEDLYVEQKQSLPKLMIQRVARHFMLYSQNIRRENLQRLNAKLWEGKLESKNLIIQKELISKKD